MRREQMRLIGDDMMGDPQLVQGRGGFARSATAANSAELDHNVP